MTCWHPDHQFDPTCPVCQHDDHRCASCGTPVSHGHIACGPCEDRYLRRLEGEELA